MRLADMETMRVHVAAITPMEACGLLAGKAGKCVHVFMIHNEEASPTHFRMDARQQYQAFLKMERKGWTLLAIYHSHPAGPAGPSRTDLAEAMYPGVAHLIWSLGRDGWECNAFLLEGGQVSPVELQVENEQLLS